MSQEHDSRAEPLPYVSLTYFLWLPAGKDEFGFDNFNDAPLKDTAFYRMEEPLEGTIASHFEDKVTDLTDDATKLAYMVPDDTLRPTDGELGLRKIHFGFSYNHSHPGLSGYVRDEPIPGTAIFFSNGLYLWSFRVPVKPGLPAEKSRNLKKVLTGFLKHDFVSRHISHIFKFKWNPGSVAGRPDDYGGILTYYQLDLLFNGAFDQSAHPHLSLGESPLQPDHSGPTPAQRAQQKYGVRYLIESLSLCAFDDEYFPLYDQRKLYTLRRTHGDTQAYVDSGVNLTSRHLEPTDEVGLHARELFLARVSFAAMEQFLRVAISFGLTYYKTGLDHIRSELISQGMQNRKNRAADELRRPSLRGRALMLADLETYHSLLVGKVPALSFLDDLVEGLSEVTKPSREVKGNGVPGAVEFQFAAGTLQEARTQFRRMVNAVKADIQAIESTLESVRADQMILELTEARKLSEIASESPRGEVRLANGKVTLEPGGGLALLFGFIGVLIGFMEVFSNVGVWLTGIALEGSLTPSRTTVFVYWLVGFTIVLLAFIGARLFLVRRREAERHERERSRSDKTETHVFDYSSLLREVKGDGMSAPLMANLRDSMIDIENPAGERGRSSSFSTFHETPSTGVERIKYSLESPVSESGLVYILHVEFDRRLSGVRRERLLDVRLVVRKPVTVRLDVIPNSHRVIADCVKSILFPDGTEGDLKNFCIERFGWDPTPSGAGMPA